jgi:prepilin-type N-terminal cleavage/methylation domain-containing protein
VKPWATPRSRKNRINLERTFSFFFADRYAKKDRTIFNMKHTQRKTQGYTLSEILIALAVLGICLAIAIPLLSQAREQTVRKAVMKEMITVLYDISRQGITNDELTPTNFSNYLLDKINGVRVCRGNASDASDPLNTNGACWDSSIQGDAEGEFNEGGVVFANGARMVGFNNCCTTGGEYTNGIYMDWNGIKPPNLVGQDQLHVILCFGYSDCSADLDIYNPPITQGNIGLYRSTDTVAASALFKTVME